MLWAFRGYLDFMNPMNILVEPIAISFHEVFLKVKVNTSTSLLTTLYASPRFAERKITWEKLSYLSDFVSLPWLLMGDFNEISHPYEKFGGNPPYRYKMLFFNIRKTF